MNKLMPTYVRCHYCNKTVVVALDSEIDKIIRGYVSSVNFVLTVCRTCREDHSNYPNIGTLLTFIADMLEDKSVDYICNNRDLIPKLVTIVPFDTVKELFSNFNDATVRDADHTWIDGGHHLINIGEHHDNFLD